MAKTTPPLSGKLKLYVAKSDLGIWLVNDTSEEVTVSAGELFGYNYGTFAEKTVSGALIIAHVVLLLSCSASNHVISLLPRQVLRSWQPRIASLGFCQEIIVAWSLSTAVGLRKSCAFRKFLAWLLVLSAYLRFQ